MADETPRVTDPVAAPQVIERVVTREVAPSPPPDPQFGVTEPKSPKDWYVQIADPDKPDGFRKVNAFGEEKGSPEDKKRW